MYSDTVLYVKQKPRLSRRESQEQTRANLIEAAEQVFIRSGFEGASVEHIAETAGYSRGAFYSNFADKEALFLAVLDKRRLDTTRAVAGIFSREPDPARRLEAVRDWYREQWRHREWITLKAEFLLRALRSRALRAQLADLWRHELESYSELVARYHSEAGLALGGRPHAIALALQAMAQGLGITAFVDSGGRHEKEFDAAADLVFDGLVRTHIGLLGQASAKG